MVDDKINNWIRKEGLGLFNLLDDEFIIDEILCYLDTHHLMKLSMVSKIFYLFATHEEIVSIFIKFFF